MGEGNRKLSKRDPQSSLQHYRDRGFVPEGLLNYLALLGWSIGEDREIFSLAEMAAAFDVTRVNPNPARFDPKKAEAINGVWLRKLPAEELASRMVPFLQSAGVLPPSPSADQLDGSARSHAVGPGAHVGACGVRGDARVPVRGWPSALA